MLNRMLRALMLPLVLVAAPALGAPGHDQEVGQSFRISPDSLPEPDGAAAPGAPPKQIARGERQPVVPDGFTVQLFVEGIPAPRRIGVGPDGVIYVAAQFAGGLLALYDRSGDGAADQAGAVLQGANNPYGMAFEPAGPMGGDMILGDADGLYRIPLNSGGRPVPLSPEGAFGEAKGHITRDVAVDPRTGEIYVAIGSMANLEAGEPAMKATIQHVTPDGQTMTTFATGLRNVTGMDFEPKTGDLYAVVMERDSMGDELVPDFLTRVQKGDDFGWPYQYIGGHGQPEFKDKGLKLVPAKLPDVLFAAHSAPLDIAFIPPSWPEGWRGDALVALHGSSDAADPRGYKVVRVHFRDGRPDGSYDNFMTGFWVSGEAPAEVWGRPASLAFDRDGALLVGDDLGGTIWRVTPPKAAD